MRGALFTLVFLAAALISGRSVADYRPPVNLNAAVNGVVGSLTVGASAGATADITSTGSLRINLGVASGILNVKDSSGNSLLQIGGASSLISPQNTVSLLPPTTITGSTNTNNSALLENRTLIGTWSGSGILSTGGAFVFNENVNVGSANYLEGLTITVNSGGAATTGNRIAGEFDEVLQTASANTNGMYNALKCNGVIKVTDGGTGTTYLTAQGTIFGCNAAAGLTGTATNVSQVIALETDSYMIAGTSAMDLMGLQVVQPAIHVTAAARTNAAISINNASVSSPGWTVGLGLGRNGAAWPFASTATLLGAVASPDASSSHYPLLGYVATNIADFRLVNCSGLAWASPALQASCTGTLSDGALTITPTATGATIDATLSQVTAAAPVTGGTGYSATGVVNGPNGGLYQIATVGGGGVTTGLTVLVPDYYPSGSKPTNPVALTGSNGSGTLTANLTFADPTLLTIGNASRTTSLLGTVTAPTPTALDSSTKVATTAFSSAASNLTSGTVPAARIPLPSTFHGAYVICSSGASSTHTGDQLETNLAVCTIPANTLGANAAIRVTTMWTFTGNTDTKTLTIRHATTSGAVSGGTAFLSDPEATTLRVSVTSTTMIWNANSVSSQTGSVNSIGGNSSGTSSTAAATPGSINTANDSFINFNCKDLTSSADTCGITSYLVEVLNP